MAMELSLLPSKTCGTLQRFARLALLLTPIFTILLCVLYHTSYLNVGDRIIISSLNPNKVSQALVARQDTVPSTTSTATASSTGILNVFQVSLPVLGQTGPTSANVVSDNSTDATGNASTTVKSGCQVAKFACRKLYSAQLHGECQYRYYEFFCDIERRPIRSTCFDVCTPRRSVEPLELFGQFGIRI
jgi:hypothetical protein